MIGHVLTWEGVDTAFKRLRTFMQVHTHSEGMERAGAAVTFGESVGLTRETQEQALINVSEVLDLNPGTPESAWAYFGFLTGLIAVQESLEADPKP